MNLRYAIVWMSGLAVLSDAVLIAFYPQFFEQRYGVTSSFHVGAYVAAISLAVMCTLPLWARIAKRTETMRLLQYTQAGAGCLCVLSYWADTVNLYWLLTLLMFMCKSSYLLMFPYLLRHEHPDTHSNTVGLLSVIVHLGAIAGAIIGGWVMQHWGPAFCLWIMAAGDFAQWLICWKLRSSGKLPITEPPASAGSVVPVPSTSIVNRVLILCLVLLIFDFSAHLISPFFTVYWEQVSGIGSQVITGLVFAIPGLMALLALLANKLSPARLKRRFEHLQTNLLLGAVGLAMQAVPQVWVMVLGRAVFGWALFQAIVSLEVSVFRFSTPSAYALDYSRANFFQNLGVLLASFAAGALVAQWGIQISFVIGAAGLLLTAAVERTWLGIDQVDHPPPQNHASSIPSTTGTPSHVS